LTFEDRKTLAKYFDYYQKSRLIGFKKTFSAWGRDAVVLRVGKQVMRNSLLSRQKPAQHPMVTKTQWS